MMAKWQRGLHRDENPCNYKIHNYNVLNKPLCISHIKANQVTDILECHEWLSLD